MSDLACCRLCPRECGADRLSGERGFCGGGSAAELFRWGPHRGEEPPVSGTRGSGTVFFSRCTLRCLYCQNHPWSQGGAGRPVKAGELANVLRQLRDAGCHNWNLVSPTPWLPIIREALAETRRDGNPGIPVVYNTSGFEREKTLESYGDVADVFLTDLRYAAEETALEASGNARYAGVARSALLAMRRLKGDLRLDADGTARSGVICRLLVLPGHAGEAVANLRWLASQAPATAVSVMAQYTPAHRAVAEPPWNRRVSRDEYETVLAAVEELGFENGWTQEWGAAPPSELVGFNMPAGFDGRQQDLTEWEIRRIPEGARHERS